jgi:Mg/Co/Ni transporter MgtE
VFLLDDEGRLAGAAFVVALLRCEPSRPLAEVSEREPVWVGTDADLPEVARMMTDYNLVMLPVLDGESRMVGVVTVDDVLELTLPSGWRRRFGVASD